MLTNRMLTQRILKKDMLTDQNRKRQLSQHLLLIQSALLLLLQPAFVWWSSALYAGLLLWHGYRSYFGRQAVKPLIINLLALLMLVPIMAAGRQLGVLHLMLHILLLAVILRLLLLQRLADLKQLIWVQYFLIACCFIFYQSISMALLVIAVFVLNLALQYRTFSSAHSLLPVVSLLRAAVLTLPIWLALFLLFPRIGPLWQIPSQQSAITGLGDSLDPGSIENLVQSDELAFRVNFQSERPQRQEWYWRAKVYEEFDGRRWQVHARFNQRSSTSTTHELQANDQYQIIAEASHQRDLFSLGVPVSLSTNISRRPAELVMANSVLSQRFSYQLSSSRSPPALAFARETDINLQLTNHNPRARAFADELANKHPEPAQLVTAIAEYFANEPFYYSLQPPLLGANSVDQFLFDSRVGFCSHYASATAVLLRAAGIPARVVGGYQGGEWQQAQNYLMVRQRDAHAWVEYLDDGLWQRFDPTAVIAPQRVLQGLDQSLSAAEQALLQGWQPNWWRQASLQLMHLDYYWSVWVLGFNEQKQLSLWQSLSNWLNLWRQWPILHILAGLLVSGISITLGMVAWRWQQRRQWPFSIRARYMIRNQLQLSVAADGKSLSAQLQQRAEQLANNDPKAANWLEQLRQHYEKLVYAADNSSFSAIVTLLQQPPKCLNRKGRRIKNG